MNAEFSRAIRVIVTPAVVLLVDSGVIPEAAKHDAINAGAILISLAGVYAWDLIHERHVRDEG